MLDCKWQGAEDIMLCTADGEHDCTKTVKLRGEYWHSKPSRVNEQLASEDVGRRHFEYLIGISMECIFPGSSGGGIAAFPGERASSNDGACSCSERFKTHKLYSLRGTKRREALLMQ